LVQRRFVYLHGDGGGARFAPIRSTWGNGRKYREKSLFPTVLCCLLLPLQIRLKNEFSLYFAWHFWQVIHGDLKPENILIRAKDNRLKLIDFGFSHFVHSNESLEVFSYFGEKIQGFYNFHFRPLLFFWFSLFLFLFFFFFSFSFSFPSGARWNGTLLSTVWRRDDLLIRRLVMWCHLICHADVYSPFLRCEFAIQNSFGP